MRHVLPAAILSLIPAVVLAQDAGLPRIFRIGRQSAFVYEQADYLAPVIDTLLHGDSVRVVEREGHFVRIEFGDRDGWVLEANLARTDRRPDRASAGADSSAAKRPLEVQDAIAPQCAAVTRAGRQCLRHAADGSVYCWQHGGRR